MSKEFKSGPIIKKMRIHVGLNQNEFAKKIGVNQSFISKVETGRKDVSLTKFLDLCDMFELNPCQLFKKN